LWVLLSLRRTAFAGFDNGHEKKSRNRYGKSMPSRSREKYQNIMHSASIGLSPATKAATWRWKQPGAVHRMK
jgi:hypothetical protein